MSLLARRIVAASTVLVMLGCIVPTLALPIAHGATLGLFAPDLGAAISFAITGAFLLVRVRGQVTRLAVIMCAQGIGSSLTSLTIVLFNLAALSGPLRGVDLWVAWVNYLVWVPGIVLLTCLIVLFPNGAVPARSWSWLILAAIGFGSLFEILGVLGRHGVLVDRPYAFAPNPTGFIYFGPDLEDAIGNVSFYGMIGCFAVSVVSLIARRHNTTGVERAQYTSLLFGATISVVVLVVVAVQPDSLQADLPLFVIELFAILPVPASIAFAVLRYRLFAIDRIVSRTVTYTLVLTVLALIYIGVLVGFANLVPAQFGQLGVATATVLVTLLALPLARRIRNIIDRRFDRSRYDAEQVVAEFAARLRTSPESGDIPADVLSVVQRTFAPTGAGVWLNQPFPQDGTALPLSYRDWRRQAQRGDPRVPEP